MLLKKKAVKLYKRKCKLEKEREMNRKQWLLLQKQRLIQKIKMVSLKEKEILIKERKLTVEIKSLSDRGIARKLGVSNVTVSKWIKSEKKRIGIKEYAREEKASKKQNRTKNKKTPTHRHSKDNKNFKDTRYDPLPIDSPYTDTGRIPRSWIKNSSF